MDVWAAEGIARSYPTTTKIGLKICAFDADDAVGLMLRKLSFLKAVNTQRPVQKFKFPQVHVKSRAITSTPARRWVPYVALNTLVKASRATPTNPPSHLSGGSLS